VTRHSGNKDAAQHLVANGEVQREFYTIAEFAAACYLATDTVYRMRSRGDIHAVRLGGEWRIPRTEIERLTAAAQPGAGERRTA
jgi:excisionase family DNA binding protein